MSSKKAPADATDPPTGGTDRFESALEDLQRIVVELESGDLQLTESLERYELGIRRLKQCHQYLEAAELRIAQLVGFDADGNPVLQSLDAEGSGDLVEKQATRQRRRTVKRPAAESSGDEEHPAERGSVRPSMDDSPELF